MQTIAVLEISEIEVLRKIATMKPALEKLIEVLSPGAKRKENAWTTSTDFRKSNDDMSNSTFWRRVKNGRIEP